jgi:phage terminase small subunit
MTRQITKAKKNAIEEAGQGLTDMQRNFVNNLFIPGITQEEAAIQAGYSARSADTVASKTIRLPHVRDYLAECVEHSIHVSSVNAVNVVNELSNGAKSPYVRLQAAQDILDRAGHKPKDGAAINVGELVVNIDLT